MVLTSRWSHVAHVESASEPGVRHEIKRHVDGRLGCSCLAYRFARRDAKHCKHIAATMHAAMGTRCSSMLVQRDVISVGVAGETFHVTRRAIAFKEIPDVYHATGGRS